MTPADPAPPRSDGLIDAVTFDFWNTLVRETGDVRKVRMDAAAGVLAAAGVDVDRAELEAAFGRAWDVYVDEHWKSNRPFGAAEAVDLVLADLGYDEELAEPLVKIFIEPPASRRPPLADNIAACLGELRDRGVAIGIICDVGLTPSPVLRRYLRDHDVLDHFDHWSFSDEVGVFKPDPRIFTHALDGLSAAVGRALDPGRVAHVGDLRRTDIAGARAFGFTAVRYTGVFDDPGDADEGTDTIEGHLVLDDHAYLCATLGVSDPKALPG